MIKYLFLLIGLLSPLQSFSEEQEAFSKQGCVVLGQMAAYGALKALGGDKDGKVGVDITRYLETAQEPVKSILEGYIAQGRNSHQYPLKQFEETYIKCIQAGGDLVKLAKPEV